MVDFMDIPPVAKITNTSGVKVECSPLICTAQKLAFLCFVLPAAVGNVSVLLAFLLVGAWVLNTDVQVSSLESQTPFTAMSSFTRVLSISR